jgi:hypothetical protein
MYASKFHAKLYSFHRFMQFCIFRELLMIESIARDYYNRTAIKIQHMINFVYQNDFEGSNAL